MAILWFFLIFSCCYETRKSILPPWVGSKVQRNPRFSRLCFSPKKKLTTNLYHTTVCGTNTFPKGKTCFLSWHPTNQPRMYVRKKTITLSLARNGNRNPEWWGDFSQLIRNTGGGAVLVLVCYAATQLATQLRQRCTQVLCSNKEARKRLTESNGTPAMDLDHMNIVLK